MRFFSSPYVARVAHISVVRITKHVGYYVYVILLFLLSPLLSAVPDTLFSAAF